MVPLLILLMALRLDPVRPLIADDVGVGKTIEALLIARELWDRGEVRRIGMLCSPTERLAALPRWPRFYAERGPHTTLGGGHPLLLPTTPMSTTARLRTVRRRARPSP
jgi:hypothetical protein